MHSLGLGPGLGLGLELTSNYIFKIMALRESRTILNSRMIHPPQENILVIPSTYCLFDCIERDLCSIEGKSRHSFNGRPTSRRSSQESPASTRSSVNIVDLISLAALERELSSKSLRKIGPSTKPAAEVITKPASNLTKGGGGGSRSSPHGSVSSGGKRGATENAKETAVEGMTVGAPGTMIGSSQGNGCTVEDHVPSGDVNKQGNRQGNKASMMVTPTPAVNPGPQRRKDIKAITGPESRRRKDWGAGIGGDSSRRKDAAVIATVLDPSHRKDVTCAATAPSVSEVRGRRDKSASSVAEAPERKGAVDASCGPTGSKCKAGIIAGFRNPTAWAGFGAGLRTVKNNNATPAPIPSSSGGGPPTGSRPYLSTSSRIAPGIQALMAAHQRSKTTAVAVSKEGGASAVASTAESAASRAHMSIQHRNDVGGMRQALLEHKESIRKAAVAAAAIQAAGATAEAAAAAAAAATAAAEVVISASGMDNEGPILGDDSGFSSGGSIKKKVPPDPKGKVRLSRCKAALEIMGVVFALANASNSRVI